MIVPEEILNSLILLSPNLSEEILNSLILLSPNLSI